ncbi:MAG: glutathione S-transferase [Alphaproteobacteria bacterium]|nr:glutathione S-transferase [Alphaproteobacteria bacterium]
MATTRGLTLYHIPQSRSLTALWMLEELGLPYRVRKLDLAAAEQRGAAYLKINPSGKVPALADGPMVVTERGAICMHLADRYAPGRLAPIVVDPRRAEYLSWMFYAAGVLEPLLTLAFLRIEMPAPPGALAWGDWTTMTAVVRDAVAHREFLLGNQFSAADIMVGSMLAWALGTGVMEREGPTAAYVERLAARPARQRATMADGGRQAGGGR